MEFLLIWICLGAVVGYAAASKRGWSTTAGLLGGAVLGILSPALFAVSGVSRNERACPHCAERIKKAAKVCRHCGRDV